MLDIGFHQAAGLHSFTPQSELRVVAVASQDNAGTGLETLWQICASLQRLGYPVVVLDGTAQETDEYPGLLHLLQQAPWNEGVSLNMGAMASSLAVIPAAKGLQRIGREASRNETAPLHALVPYFRTYGLVVLHASGTSAHDHQRNGGGIAAQRVGGRAAQNPACVADAAGLCRTPPGWPGAHHHNCHAKPSGPSAP